MISIKKFAMAVMLIAGFQQASADNYQQPKFGQEVYIIKDRGVGELLSWIDST